ncbi:MAG: DUF1294 domain-containing protein [Ruegeria sp.]|uniref:DUF1294 domain-containing protein n=1 Tax=Ruegeria sp. TaxID=1879320 RepID=UPI00349ED0EF
MWIAIMYLWIVNGVTVLAFGWDKLQARRRRWRIPERRLLWLAAIGGSPGALVGRWIFRHKTRKRGFVKWLFIIVAIQAVVGYFLLTEILPDLR